MILFPILCLALYGIIYYKNAYPNELFYDLEEIYLIKYKKYKNLSLKINLNEKEKQIFSNFNKINGPTLLIVGGWTRGKVIYYFLSLVSK
jgi:hypothetical protein